MQELWKYEKGIWILVGPWTSFEIIKENGRWVALHKLIAHEQI